MRQPTLLGSLTGKTESHLSLSSTQQLPPFHERHLWQSPRTKAATLTSGKLIYYLSTSACLFKEVRWPPLVHLCEAEHHTEFSSVAAISQMGKDAALGCSGTLYLIIFNLLNITIRQFQVCYNLNNVNMLPLSSVCILFLTYFTHKNILMHFLAAGKWPSSRLVKDLITLWKCFTDEYL